MALILKRLVQATGRDGPVLKEMCDNARSMEVHVVHVRAWSANWLLRVAG